MVKITWEMVTGKGKRDEIIFIHHRMNLDGEQIYSCSDENWRDRAIMDAIGKIAEALSKQIDTIKGGG